MKKLVLFVSLLTSASVAIAQPRQPGNGGVAPSGPQKARPTPAEKFAALDANRDGAISKGEAPVAGRFAKHFDQIDANSDGLLTVAELTAAKAAREQKHLQRRGEHFDRMDTDKNGAISREEFVKRPPPRGQHGGKNHRGGQGRRGGRPGQGDQGPRPGA